jgi:hypothetical protein
MILFHYEVIFSAQVAPPIGDELIDGLCELVCIQSWPVVSQKFAASSSLGKSGIMFLVFTTLSQSVCWALAI